MPQDYEEIYYVVIIGSTVTVLVAGFLISFVYLYHRRHHKYLGEKQHMQHIFQQELLKTQLEIQEQTFENISQEIHDNIGQSLSFIKLNIGTFLIDDVSDSPKEKLVQSKDLLTQVIQDLRDLSKTLNTDFINDIGLVNAVQQQLQWLEKTGLYHINLSIVGQPVKYPLQRELVLFRIIQEVLNNIIKHAEAKTITIAMNYQTEKFTVTIRDDGKGFDTDKLQSDMGYGLGLRNMSKRMTLIHGFITVDSSPEKGTTVTLDLPKL